MAQGEAAAPAGGSPFTAIVPWIIIAGLFYVMLIRPDRQRRAELDDKRANLKKNDRVVTVGGILGTITHANKDSQDVTIRVDEGNNTRIRVLRSSIQEVITGDTPDSSNQ